MMRFPEISRFAAVAVEGPIILTASWITCGFLVRKFTIANRWQDRAIMGGIAFALLMIAETTTSSLLFGQSIAEQVAQYREPAYALGLAGQMLFGVIPLLVGRH